jgi:hypothetical protein
MTQQILCLSGRKQSGKNTAINFIVGMYMHSIGLIKDRFTITEHGELYISDINGDNEFEGIFDIFRGTPAMEIFLADNLDSVLKVYSFADLLKTEVCMKILGLTYEQVYGSDDKKNELTHLKWEDMPNIIVDDEFHYQHSEWFMNNPEYQYHQSGPMTAREVLQYVGTNIFRKMYNDVWVDATMRRIKDEGAAVALICDCRFPNEVFGTQKNGGKVIRLTRNPHPEDKHPSETALDRENFDWSKFDAVIENENITIPQQNEAIYNTLKGWNMCPIELEINK